MAAVASQPSREVTATPYPASTRTVSASAANIPTTVTRISFDDKILVTISQAGRLNHWVHVPLLNAAPHQSEVLGSGLDPEDERPDSTLLPYSHLTATTVFGGTKPEFEVLGQTLATTLASVILTRQPDESRMLVVGLGLENADAVKDVFEAVIGLCLDVL